VILQSWPISSKKNPSIKAVSLQTCVTDANIVIFAVGWKFVHGTLMGLGSEIFKGKIVIDVTNPILDNDSQFVGELVPLERSSAGEEVQSMLDGIAVVKAWNSIGHSFMIDPPFEKPTMPICGNDKPSKEVVSKLLVECGWTPLDLGGIHLSRAIEPLCSLWCVIGMTTGNWANAFQVLSLHQQK